MLCEGALAECARKEINGPLLKSQSGVAASLCPRTPHVADFVRLRIENPRHGRLEFAWLMEEICADSRACCPSAGARPVPGRSGSNGDERAVFWPIFTR